MTTSNANRLFCITDLFIHKLIPQNFPFSTEPLIVSVSHAAGETPEKEMSNAVLETEILKLSEAP